MSEKSHVSLETHICPVCGKEHETNTILLDRRLRDSLEKHTCTGYSLCEKHFKKDFICMIGADESKTTLNAHGNVDTPAEVHRIGVVAYIRKERWSAIFNTPVPPDGFCYAPNEVFELLERMQQGAPDG